MPARRRWSTASPTKRLFAPTTVPVVTDLGVVAGSGWAAGLNLWSVGLVLGIAGRLDLYESPEVLQRTEVLAILAVLYIAEFVVDKIPYIDSAWDVISTIIRPVGAALIGLALAKNGTDTSDVTAALTAGGLALSSHGAKATIRAAINISPEPVSNFVASITEDTVAIGLSSFALAYPRVAFGVAIVLGISAAIVAFVLFRFVRRLWLWFRSGRERAAT